MDNTNRLNTKNKKNKICKNSQKKNCKSIGK